MKNKNPKPALAFIVPGAAQRQAWDALVMQHAGGTVYSLSWYLDTVAGKDNWGLVCDENITTGLPVAFKKRAGYKNVYQPFYTMFFNTVNPLYGLDVYLDTIVPLFNRVHITTHDSVQNYTARERVRQECMLTGEQAYSENARRQIKKAEKNGLAFAMHTDAAEVVRLFAENKGRELKEYKRADFKTLEKLAKTAMQKGHGFCAHVTHQNEVPASGFFLTFGNRVVFLKGGVSPEGKNMGAMFYLMHCVMQHCKGQYEIFDFGGSNNANVAGFYRKMGGTDLTYYEADIDRRNLAQKLMARIRK